MGVRGLQWLTLVVAALASVEGGSGAASARQRSEHWIGTWSAAPQPPMPGRAQTFRNQTVRLIVRTSVGGTKLRIRLSNLYGDEPLAVGRVRVAKRATGADAEPGSDRPMMFQGQASTTIPARATAISDPVELQVSALGELAVSLFFEQSAVATTFHALAQQTNYVSSMAGDVTDATTFRVGETLDSWPFLTGVDVVAASRGAAIVAFGSSTTDGDGSTVDANRRWPDLLAERLQRGPHATRALGVLNQGIIGNRLLFDSPSGPSSPYGLLLGEAGLTRFDRDVLGQVGVRHVIVGLGINDITFPALPFTSPHETVTAARIIDGYRALIARARRAGVRTILTTLGPFEGRVFTGGGLEVMTYSADRERLRQDVNAWIRSTAEADGMVDFDAVIRDPRRPTRLLPAYDSGDHLHVNDAGNAAQAKAIPLGLFSAR